MHGTLAPMAHGQHLGSRLAISRSPAGRGGARPAAGGRTGPCLHRTAPTRCSAEPVDRDHPAWAGKDDPLSKAVNAVINFPPLWGVMKQQARKTLITTAEKKGIPWVANANALEASGAMALLDEMTNKDVEYPDYYLQAFHAYDDGNLNWPAAFEVESATYSMALRVWPKEEDLTAEAAQQRLRDSFTGAIQEYRERVGAPEVEKFIDVGCSVGISTRAVARAFPGASGVGLDLSPHFLAVAKYREGADPADVAIGIQKRREGDRPIEWVHANAEATGLPDASFDLVVVPFVFHECPTCAIRSILHECRRILRKGGTLAFTDNDPKSPVIQGLPPVLFTLMKSTEPWSDEYYTTNIEEIMRQEGYGDVESTRTDPRHRTVQGQAV